LAQRIGEHMLRIVHPQPVVYPGELTTGRRQVQE
jgi:hypothetical protein